MGLMVIEVRAVVVVIRGVWSPRIRRPRGESVVEAE